MSRAVVTAAELRAARTRIAPFVHRTPVMTSSTLDARAGVQLFFKCENLQRGGAFKARGATNAVLQLPGDVTAVVTHSSGNHAQAVALAARERGLTAHIVMPRTSSPVKRRAVEGYGGRIYLCEPTTEAREQRARELVDETGGALIPPFDHPHVIAGQGTLALEVVEQVGDLDALIAPVGGGGLLAGLALGAAAARPGLRVLGAEPLLADDTARSLATGVRQLACPPRSIADGLLTRVGELTWPVIRDRVERVVTVSEEAIASAMWLVWERMKLVIEPSAAVPLAALLRGDFPRTYRRVAVVFTGGNVDFDRLPPRPSASL